MLTILLTGALAADLTDWDWVLPVGEAISAPIPAFISPGDLDGDGRDELIVSRGMISISGTNVVDRVFVLSGARRRSVLAPLTTITAPSGSNFGADLALMDVDLDGDRDLIVSAPQHANGGRLYVFEAPLPAGPLSPADARWTLEGTGRTPRGNSPLIVLPDRDADGLEELAVAVHDATTPVGTLYLLDLSGLPIAGTVNRSQLTVATLAGSPGQLSPWEARSVGDRDGDGYPEVAVTGWNNHPPGDLLLVHDLATIQGNLWLRDHVMTLTAAASGMITTVEGSADLDGDGLPELLVGTPNAQLVPGGGGGAIWVVPGTWVSSPSVNIVALDSLAGAITVPIDHGNFGRQLGSLGDRDGDGLDDWASCAESYRLPHGGRGLCFWQRGTASLPAPGTIVPPEPRRLYLALPDTELVQNQLFTGADLDGDGKRDLLFFGSDTSGTQPLFYPAALLGFAR